MPITDFLSQASSSGTARPVTAQLTGAGHTASGTSITVNVATNWSTTTVIYFAIFDTTTVGSLVVKDTNTQTDWKGTLSGTTISNMTIVGGTDRDYSAGAVVELTPLARQWKDLYDWGTNEHNQDGTHDEKLITSRTAITSTTTSDQALITDADDSNALKKVTLENLLPNNSVTHLKVANGMVVQKVYANYSGVDTTTTVLPHDDTVPQNTEGKEFMSLAITPKSSTNLLDIEISFRGATSVTTDVVGALFQDSTADALTAAASNVLANNAGVILVLRHIMVAGTTSATTFNLRAGPGGAATLTFNGFAGARKFGGIPKSTISITEYKAS